MSENEINITNLLVRYRIIDPKTCSEALKYKQTRSLSSEQALIYMGAANHKQIAHARAIHAGWPYLTLDQIDIDPETVAALPQDIVVKHQILPVIQIHDTLVVVVGDPLAVKQLDGLSTVTTWKLFMAVAPKPQIAAAILKIYPNQATPQLESHEPVSGATVTPPAEDLVSKLPSIESTESDTESGPQGYWPNPPADNTHQRQGSLHDGKSDSEQIPPKGIFSTAASNNSATRTDASGFFNISKLNGDSPKQSSLSPFKPVESREENKTHGFEAVIQKSGLSDSGYGTAPKVSVPVAPKENDNHVRAMTHFEKGLTELQEGNLKEASYALDPTNRSCKANIQHIKKLSQNGKGDPAD